MKKLVMILLSAFLMVGVVSTSAFADAAKGQKYYLKFFKKKTGITGAEFATQHTISEWENLFANSGEAFVAEYSKKFPKLAEFFSSEKFKTKYMEHIKDFCVQYASDSGNVPSC